MFPLSLASEGSCTIGGNLSTNAGGTAVLRFGNTRELVLGIEVVLADGRVWDGLRGLRKDNTGYDLKQLFIGAEGTLGIVTAAVLKLFPAPRHAATALAAVPTVERGGRRCCARLKQALGDRLTGFELMQRVRARRCRASTIPALPDPLPGPSRGTCWCRPTTARADAPLAAAARRRARPRRRSRRRRRTPTIAQSEEQARRAVGAAREHQRSAAPRRPEHQARHLAAGVRRFPRSWTSAAPRSRAAFPGVRFVDLRPPGRRQPALQPRRAGGRRRAARSWTMPRVANRIVHDLVARTGGSISAEHGIGQLKRDELVALQERRRDRADARGQGRARSRRDS